MDFPFPYCFLFLVEHPIECFDYLWIKLLADIDHHFFAGLPGRHTLAAGPVGCHGIEGVGDRRDLHPLFRCQIGCLPQNCSMRGPRLIARSWFHFELSDTSNGYLRDTVSGT
jgi:hypothetical protein